MHKSCSPVLIMAVAVVSLFTLLPDSASAAPCTMRTATTAIERASLWNEAIDAFSARPGLTPEQTQFLREAGRFGEQIAALKEDSRAQAAFARRATRLMERARELFTKSQLGELFTSMGETQVWFSEVVAAEAYCNCIGAGSCSMGPGGPSGSCSAGCTSWDGSDGQRRDGLCGSANVE